MIVAGSARKSRGPTEGVAYACATYLGAGDANNARNYSTNVDLNDPQDGAPLFQMKGLAWAEMETSDKEKVPQFMHVKWNADIDMLMEGDPTFGTKWLGSKTVQQVIDLVAHKRPELGVLEVNLSTQDGFNLWLEQGEDETDNPIRAGCSQHHFAVRDPKTLIQAQERFASCTLSPQLYLVMDVTKRTKIAVADSIDLAIINPGLEDLGEVDAFVQSLALSVRDRGFIISNGSTHIDSLARTIHLSNDASICRVEKQKTALSIDGEAEVPQKSVTRINLSDGAAQVFVEEKVLKVCDDLAT
jgi:hypothetical protein